MSNIFEGLEEALSKAHQSPRLVNNLFQLDNGLWRCNMREGDKFFAFCDKARPADAVLGALTQLTWSPGRKNPTQVPDIEIEELEL